MFFRFSYEIFLHAFGLLFFFLSLFLLYLNYKMSTELEAVMSQAENLEALALKLQTKVELLSAAAPVKEVVAVSNNYSTHDVALGAFLFLLSVVCLFALKSSLCNKGDDILPSNPSWPDFSSHHTADTVQLDRDLISNISHNISRNTDTIGVKSGEILECISDVKKYAGDIQGGVIDLQVELDTIQSVFKDLSGPDAFLNLRPDVLLNLPSALSNLEAQIRTAIDHTSSLGKAVQEGFTEITAGVTAHIMKSTEQSTYLISYAISDFARRTGVRLDWFVNSPNLAKESQLDALSIKVAAIENKLNILLANTPSLSDSVGIISDVGSNL